MLECGRVVLDATLSLTRDVDEPGGPLHRESGAVTRTLSRSHMAAIWKSLIQYGDMTCWTEDLHSWFASIDVNSLRLKSRSFSLSCITSVLEGTVWAWIPRFLISIILYER